MSASRQAPDSTRDPLHARLRGALARARAMVDGSVVDYSAEERARIVASQLRRSQHVLASMLGLLTLFGGIKVALIATGAWPATAPAAVYAALLAICAAAWYGYARAGSLAAEGVTSSIFLLAFLTLMVDPMSNWPDQPVKSLGILLILPVIGMPLMVLLRSALVFAAFCIAVGIGMVLAFPPDTATRYALLLNLALAVTAGLRLRVARSDMSAGFVRSMQDALLQATTDPLTGLLNRHGWSHAAPAALDAARAAQRQVTLLFIDLDHFKQLNDTHGHAEGDQALRRTGHALLARLQSGALAARMGGEEFVCLLPGLSPRQALRLAGRLRRDLQGASPVVRFSGGIASWDGEESMGKLMARADRLLYRAKTEGRDRVLGGEEGHPPAAKGS